MCARSKPDSLCRSTTTASISPLLLFFCSLPHFFPSHLTQIHKSLFIQFPRPSFFPSHTFSSISPSLSVLVKYVQLDLASSSSGLGLPTQERERGAAGLTQHEEAMDGQDGGGWGRDLWSRREKCGRRWQRKHGRWRQWTRKVEKWSFKGGGSCTVSR